MNNVMRNCQQFALLFLLLINTSVQAGIDGPPPMDIDVRYIQEPVPHWEPLSRTGNRPSYFAKHRRYHVLASRHGYHAQGIASWYGRFFHKRRTSNGEIYDMFAMTAAHKSLPLPSYVRVKNLENGRSIIVRVNDRGPFHGNRLIDLSYVAAKKLGMLKKGTARVDISVIETNDNSTNAADTIMAPYATENLQMGQTRQDFLQVGAFSNRKNADYQATQVSQITDTPVQTSAINTEHGIFYRVQIGPLTTPEMTAAIKAKLIAAGLENTIPVVQ